MDLCEKNENEYRHPWELARAECVLRELNTLGVKGNVLDIGCGDQFFDYKLAEENNNIENVFGVDIYGENSDNGKVHSVNKYEDLPTIKYDFIIMMDVLEHIKDDVGFMRYLTKYIGESTTLMLTVPAFQRLFSAHDKELHHYRRYDIRSIKLAMDSIGDYDTILKSYFFSTLIPLRLITKNKKNIDVGGWKYCENHIFTRIVKNVLILDYKIERFLSTKNIYIPGLSLIYIAKPKIQK